MANIRIKTFNDSNPKGKPRVYFTCHPADFGFSFDTISKEIFRVHNAAIYYKDDMSEEVEEKYKDSDLAQMNLFVIPVTRRLLTEPNVAIDCELAFAKANEIPILPLVMEPDIVDLYSQPSKFGDIQYLDLCLEDDTAISWRTKFERFLSRLFVSNELYERIKAAFDGYVFLSYRKKDRHYAKQLMKIIHSYPECRDIAIWYDEFLSPGDNFRDEINKSIENSRMVAMLVTPSVLEEHNYVMTEEYPIARNAKKAILPAQMELTDRSLLSIKYKDIPECADPLNKALFKEHLEGALGFIARPENDTDAEHLFLIGMAYRDGIEVEVDRKKARELFKLAADAGHPDAMFAMEHELFEDRHSTEASCDTDDSEGQYFSKLVEYIDKEVINHADKTINREKLHEGLACMISNYDDAVCYMMQMKCMSVSSEIEKTGKSALDILNVLESVYITQLKHLGMSLKSGAKMTLGMLSYLYSKRRAELDSMVEEIFESEIFLTDADSLRLMRGYMLASAAYFLDEGDEPKNVYIDGLTESLVFIERTFYTMPNGRNSDVYDTRVILENVKHLI